MEPGKRYLILGGVRSGKSSYALNSANRLGGKKLFVATAEARDQEMKNRIAEHRTRRGPDWETVEEPIHIAQLLEQKAKNYEVILIDCLTLWLSNLILKYEEKKMTQLLDDFTMVLSQIKGCHVVLVSNEVGMGIVPENKLARAFRDWAGLMNQRVARIADEVILMVAGIPTKIKGDGNSEISPEPGGKERELKHEDLSEGKPSGKA
jgi:adenosylcobinamide kinase/adenosylcobinamide-phosphate guanylyltransferase